MWPVEEVELFGLRVYRPALEKSSIFEWLSITDPKKWRAIYVHPITTQLLGFIMAKSGGHSRGASSPAGAAKHQGVFLMQVSAWMELWQHSAATGFKNFSESDLDRAISTEEELRAKLSGNRRKHHILEKILVLLEHVLPDYGVDVYGKIIRSR